MWASWLLLAVLAWPALRFTEETDTGGRLRVMSYNIRYNNPADGINAWPHRKDSVAVLIGDRYRVDLAGLQEALKDQIDDLQARLPGYAWTGKGRDDGRDAGEFSPIFYRRDRFELLEEDTFWLSATPQVPGSKGWDAAITRIVTWARFRVRDTGRTFYLFNTHFDHRGSEARTQSARLILKKTQEIAGDEDVILTGDLNVPETSQAYAILSGGETVDGVKIRLWDARYRSRTGHEGPTASFNDWVDYRGPETRIDYIFVSRRLAVHSHRILEDRFDGRFPSDHLPVLAEVEFPPVE